MRHLLPLSVVALLAGGHAPAASAQTGVLACDRNAIPKEERPRYQELSGKLMKSVLGLEETAAGFRLRLNPERLPLRDVAEWIDYESRCCPFFSYRVDISNKPRAVAVELSGPPGAKEVFRQAMQGQPSR